MPTIKHLNTPNSKTLKTLSAVGLIALSSACLNVVADEQCKDFPISKFDALKVFGDTHVKLQLSTQESTQESTQNSVHVCTDSDFIDKVIVKNSGDTLHIGPKKHTRGIFIWSTNDNHEIRAELTTSSLDAIDISGNSTIDLPNLTQENMRHDHFNIHLSGSSKLTAQSINSDNLQLDLSGSSKAKFKTLTNQSTELKLSGSSRVDLENLNSNTLHGRLSGSSDIELHRQGQGKDLQLHLSGASNFDMPEYRIQSASIEASGASRAELNVGKYLDARASGGSRIQYRGKPDTKIHRSGGASISQQN
ncbi:MAG: hypothetical protein ACI93R_001073 [Flavobacteriales bacterium]|jgi:hypothetical protein